MQVSEGDIICVRCGTNLLTGQRIIEDAKEPPARRGAGFVPGGRTLMIGAVVILLAAAAGGGAYWLILNDPLTKSTRLAAQGNHLEALNVLQPYVETHGDNGRAQALLGKLYYHLQQPDKAAAAFDVASRLDPRNEDLAWMALSAASRLQGQAGRNLELATLRRLVEMNPANSEAQYLLALALGAAGEFAEQATTLGALAAAEPDNAAAARQLAIARALAGDADGAAELLEGATIAADAASALARGLVANMQGDTEAAAANLAEGVANGSPAVKAAAGTQLGLLLMSQARFDEATRVLRDAREAPGAPEAARFFYALSLEAIGLHAEALAEYANLAQGTAAYSGEAALQLALLYLRQDNVQKAEEALRQAANTQRDSPKMHTIRGQIAQISGDSGAAQQSFRMALQIAPEYAPAHLELGLMYIQLRRLSEGLGELQQYLALVGNSKQARTPEITLLVNQLRQTLERDGVAVPPPAASARRAPTPPAPQDEITPAEEDVS